jgi:tetratricopeptide (TPR) repeat protein
MTPARLRAIEEIFHAALECKPTQLNAIPDKRCAGDEGLRSKVEALLTSHQQTRSSIETSIAGLATSLITKEQADLLIGQTIGHYKISKPIGAGGMGEVYLASDVTVGRNAALKLLPPHLTGDTDRLKRFQQEERAVARLNHFTQANSLEWDDWEGVGKSLNRKVELLEKATQRDPNFALAYCALSKTQVDLSSVSEDPKKPLELAKEAAEAALRVHPDLGEAHLELARYYFYAGVLTNDYGRARDELAIARRTLPNNAEALAIEARIGRHENRWDASLANLQKASELDPRNGDIAWHLGRIYFEMRRYRESEQLITKAAASGTLDSLSTQFLLAAVKMGQGDPVAAKSILDQVPSDYSPGPWVWGARFTAALYLRDYHAANRVIAATPANWADQAFDGPSSWAEGQVARARGDKQKAVAAFAAGREKIEAQQGDKPKDAPYFGTVAKLDVGLGQKEQAIREAQRAVELVPIAKDSLNGPALIANLALVYAWTGERDRALEQLEKVATIPGLAPTYGDLRFNPCWDDLRDDKRFDKIVAAAKAASR